MCNICYACHGEFKKFGERLMIRLVDVFKGLVKV